MCMYFSTIAFPGCVHAVSSEQLPAAYRVLFDACLAHTDNAKAAYVQYIAQNPGVDPATVVVPLSLIPACNITVYLPNSVTDAPVLDAHLNPALVSQLPYGICSLGPICPECTIAVRFMDQEWKLTMNMLKRLCAHTLVGRLRSDDMRLIPFLRRLSPASADELQFLELQRSQAFLPNYRANVFRLRNWDYLGLFQRLLVHRFITGGVAVNWSRWVDCFHLSNVQAETVKNDMMYMHNIQHWLTQTLPPNSDVLPSYEEVPDWYDGVVIVHPMDNRSPTPANNANAADVADNGNAAARDTDDVANNANDANAHVQFAALDIDALLQEVSADYWGL